MSRSTIFIISLIWGPIKTVLVRTLSFSIVSCTLGKMFFKYLKVFTFSMALTRFFINPYLICRESNITLYLSRRLRNVLHMRYWSSNWWQIGILHFIFVFLRESWYISEIKTNHLDNLKALATIWELQTTISCLPFSNFKSPI